MNKIKAVRIGNKTINYDPADKVISPEIKTGLYEKDETKFIKHFVTPEMTVCDLGAHIGYFTLLMSDLVGKKGRVFSFEPEKKNFSLLKKNKEVNKLTNITLINKAVSDKTGQAKLYLSNTNHGDHRLSYEKGRKGVAVKSTSLDTYFGKDNFIDFIKVDIQGYELQALKGMKKILTRNKNIVLMLEFWPFGLKKAGTNPLDLIRFLKSLHFNIFDLSQPYKKVSVFQLIKKYKDDTFATLICIRKTSLHFQTEKSTITSFAELKKSYEKIWRKSDLIEKDEYYKWIVSLWGNVAGKKLLDIACGNGTLLKMAHRKGLITHGIDISKNAVEKAKRISPDSSYKMGKAEKLPYPNAHFEVVSCLGSLEHFLDVDEALQEMKRVVKKDGILCIVLPNLWAHDIILEGVVRGKEISHGQELERFYTLEEAIKLFNKNKLKIVSIKKYNKPVPTDIRTGSTISSIANIIYKLFYTLFRKFIPIRLSYVFVFLLEK